MRPRRQKLARPHKEQTFPRIVVDSAPLSILIDKDGYACIHPDVLERLQRIEVKLDRILKDRHLATWVAGYDGGD